jgi:catechol 2,3-dioxygenase-like lactoylglutathione lyase family enzyme
MIRAIEHIAFAAQDTAALARWYCDVLDFSVVVDGGSNGIWFITPPEGEALVEIIPANSTARTTRARNDAGLSHLAFTVTDFDRTCEALRTKGVRFDGEPTGAPGERRLAFFFDLEGNSLQIAYRPTPLSP